MPIDNSTNNLGALVRERWPVSLLSLLETAGKIAHGLNYGLYIVGGAVRDLLLHRANLDVDLVVEGDGVEIARQLAARLKSRIVIHKRFGTATLYPVGRVLDIITARSENYPQSGALPVIKSSNLEADLFRRDFTINTLAIRVEPGPFGELIDLLGGMKDMERRLIRILHPESFVDDATRIMRALRYEQRLGFKLEEATAKALRHDVSYLETISSDRLRHELELILKEPYPEKVLIRLINEGAISVLLPSWKADINLEARLAKVRDIEPSPSLYLALFIYSMEPAQLGQFIAKFHLPSNVSKILLHTLELKEILPIVDKVGLLPSYIYKQLKDYSPTAIQANYMAVNSILVRQNLRLYLDKLRLVKTFISGKDMLKMGVEPGPPLGELLNRLLEAKLNGEVRSSDEEIKLVQSWLSERNN